MMLVQTWDYVIIASSTEGRAGLPTVVADADLGKSHLASNTERWKGLPTIVVGSDLCVLTWKGWIWAQTWVGPLVCCVDSLEIAER